MNLDNYVYLYNSDEIKSLSKTKNYLNNFFKTRNLIFLRWSTRFMTDVKQKNKQKTQNKKQRENY